MTTVRRQRPRKSSNVGSLRAASGRLLLLVALFQKIDADLVAIDPCQLAAAIGQSCGRQQQEKFFQMQAFDRTLDSELGAGLGHIFHGAVAPPGAVDAHHVRGYAALKCVTIAPASFRRHRGPAPDPAVPSARPNASLGGRWLTTSKPMVAEEGRWPCTNRGMPPAPDAPATAADRSRSAADASDIAACRRAG